MTQTDDSLLVRPTLHGQLLDRLRGMIVSGDLEPGAKIDERELCTRFGVSRTPLREALKVLASEGLVTLIPHRGAVVAALDLDALAEAFPVMGTLEALAGELSCQHATDAHIHRAERLHTAMVERYNARDLKSYFALNQQIHETILEAAGNTMLSQLYGQVSVHVRRARFTANMSEARWAQAIAEHGEILAAFKNRDGKRLSKLLRRHLDHKLETVRAAMQR